MSDWSIRQKFSQILHENLKYFHEDFYDNISTESTPSHKPNFSDLLKEIDERLVNLQNSIQEGMENNREILKVEKKVAEIKLAVGEIDKEAEALRNLL